MIRRSSRRTLLTVALAVASALAVAGVARAAFIVDPQNPNVGDTVTFTADDTHDCSVPLSCTWTSSTTTDGPNGDGILGTGQSIQTVFTSAGLRTVTLTDLLVGSESQDVTVTDPSPPIDPPTEPPPSGPPPPEAPGQFQSDPTPAPSAGLTGAGGAVKKKKKSAPSLLSPFPRVRYAGSLTPRGVELTLLYVRVPKGARVTATCARRCPASLFRQRTKKKTRDIRVRSFIGSYPAGSTLRIRVTKANRIGKYTQIYIPRNAAPRRSDMCLYPSSKKPRKCP